MRVMSHDVNECRYMCDHDISISIYIYIYNHCRLSDKTYSFIYDSLIGQNNRVDFSCHDNFQWTSRIECMTSNETTVAKRLGNNARSSFYICMYTKKMPPLRQDKVQYIRPSRCFCQHQTAYICLYAIEILSLSCRCILSTHSDQVTLSDAASNLDWMLIMRCFPAP